MPTDGVDRLRYMGHGLGKGRGDTEKRNPVADYVMIVARTFLIGPAIKNIYDSVSIVTGGVSGVAITAKEPWSAPLWPANTVLNTLLFVAELFFCGWRFVKHTLLATIMLSASLYILSETSYLGSDLFLPVLSGRIVSGVGTGLVLLTSCTAGDTDLLAALIQKRLRHYTLAQIMQVLDGLVVMAGTSVSGIRDALYTLIATFCMAKATDDLIEGPRFSKQAYVVSEHYREITEAVMGQAGGGVTSLEARGTYLDQEEKMPLYVVSKKRTMRLKEIVAEFDNSAFVIVNDAREVFGEGFIEYQALDFVAFADTFGKDAAD